MKAEPLEAGATSKGLTPKQGVNRGLSIMDFILRIFATIGTLGSAIVMGTTSQTLPFFTQFVQFSAQYSDIHTFS
jgi:hypothetical protein